MTAGHSPRRAFRGLRGRPPLRPVAAAGVVLIASWAGVSYALDSGRDARMQAARLAIVAESARDLADTQLLVQGIGSPVLARRAERQSMAEMATMRDALSALPADQPRIAELREFAERVPPAGSRVMTLVRQDRFPAAQAAMRERLQPVLRALRDRSTVLHNEELARVERVEDGAQVASGLALLGGSLGLGFVAITATRRRQSQLLTSQREEIEQRTASRLDALVSQTTDAVAVVDADGHVHWISRNPGVSLAYSPAELVGRPFTDLIHPPDRRRAAHAFADLLLDEGATTTVQLRLAVPGGAPRPVEVCGENRLADEAIAGVILTLHDISERTLLEDQLERLASRDPITGVANRAQLEAHLQSAIAHRSDRNALVALLLVDLEDFRAVSDTLGHDAGDELLRHAARRLEGATAEGDLVARLDGATFAVMLDDLHSVGEGQGRATTVLQALRGRTAISGGHSVDIDAHGGLAFGADDVGARELIRHADIALLEARGESAAGIVSFTDRMRNKVTERVALTGDLRRATERDEFEVDYQPIVELASGDTVGVEALARWTHPHRGRLSPMSFVDLAEQTGLIRPLGELILRQSCRDIAALLREQPGAVEYVSVNISPRQLEAPDVADVVASALDHSGLDPSCLMLELTERSIATDPERVIERLVGLRALGIRIALDDFGSGYSFMSFLEDYPLDALKIDRSLAKTIAERHDAALLLRGIVEIGRLSDMRVIVEGIETEAQAARARELGIELGQGFLFARPAQLGQLTFS